MNYIAVAVAFALGVLAGIWFNDLLWSLVMSSLGGHP